MYGILSINNKQTPYKYQISNIKYQISNLKVLILIIESLAVPQRPRVVAVGILQLRALQPRTLQEPAILTQLLLRRLVVIHLAQIWFIQTAGAVLLVGVILLAALLELALPVETHDDDDNGRERGY